MRVGLVQRICRSNLNQSVSWYVETKGILFHILVAYYRWVTSVADILVLRAQIVYHCFEEESGCFAKQLVWVVADGFDRASLAEICFVAVAAAVVQRVFAL